MVVEFEFEPVVAVILVRRFNTNTMSSARTGTMVFGCGKAFCCWHLDLKFWLWWSGSGSGSGIYLVCVGFWDRRESKKKKSRCGCVE